MVDNVVRQLLVRK